MNHEHRKAAAKMSKDMDTPGFTPGPWDVEPLLTPDENDDPMGVYVVSQAEADLSQRYYAAEPESPELESVHAENAANARLIAAAPDLYAAMDSLLAEVHDLHDEGPEGEGWQSPELQSAIASARAALARANGGAA